MRTSLYLAVFLLFIACNGEKKDLTPVNEPVQNMPDSIAKNEMDSERPTYYVWEVDFENKTMKQNPAVKTAHIHLDSIITGLNRKYPDIPLRKVKSRNDTLFMEITNSYHLTQAMGSSGALQYLADAVINLTSVPSVKYVGILFEEGDHASPGIWSREDYANIRVLK